MFDRKAGRSASTAQWPAGWNPHLVGLLLTGRRLPGGSEQSLESDLQRGVPSLGEVLLREHGGSDVGWDAARLVVPALLGQEDFVRQAEAPAIRERADEDVGINTLRAFSYARDRRPPGPQGQRRSLSRAGG